MATKYHLHLKGYVGGYDFDSDYVDYILNKYQDDEVNVLIDSLGGSLATALSIASAFRRHGNVNVHFAGMNASAATIASMGAKHISMDSSAMYLVHKCSVEFFQWATANSDKLADIIKDAKQMKTDLEKMDANVAQMYAAKCGKPADELLALMKRGGWLTSDEAYEWGFVDEITNYDEDTEPVIDSRIAAYMQTSGIPMPDGYNFNEGGILNKIISFFENMFNKPKSNDMEEEKKITDELNPETEEQQVETVEVETTEEPTEEETVEEPTEEPTEEGTTEETDAADQMAAQLQAYEEEIAMLKAQIDELKASPGDQTSHVIDNKKESNNDFGKYFDTEKSARELYKFVKR